MPSVITRAPIDGVRAHAIFRQPPADKPSVLWVLEPLVEPDTPAVFQLPSTGQFEALLAAIGVLVGWAYPLTVAVELPDYGTEEGEKVARDGIAAVFGGMPDGVTINWYLPPHSHRSEGAAAPARDDAGII